MKFEEIFDDISQRTTKTICVHMAEEADVKDREKNSIPKMIQESVLGFDAPQDRFLDHFRYNFIINI